MTQRFGYFEVFKGKGTQPWNWRWVAANGRIQAHGEGHPSRRNARRAIRDYVGSLLSAYGKQPFTVDWEWIAHMIRDGKPRK